jgi:hypothetical protein
MYICIYVCAYVCIHTCSQYVCMRMCTYAHVCIHTHIIHTYIHTQHKHTHTYIQWQIQLTSEAQSPDHIKSDHNQSDDDDSRNISCHSMLLGRRKKRARNAAANLQRNHNVRGADVSTNLTSSSSSNFEREQTQKQASTKSQLGYGEQRDQGLGMNLSGSESQGMNVSGSESQGFSDGHQEQLWVVGMRERKNVLVSVCVSAQNPRQCALRTRTGATGANDNMACEPGDNRHKSESKSNKKTIATVTATATATAGGRLLDEGVAVHDLSCGESSLCMEEVVECVQIAARKVCLWIEFMGVNKIGAK